MALVVLHERSRLGLVDIKTMLDGLRLVVVALVHLATAPRAHIDTSRSGIPAAAAGAAGGEALHDDGRVDIDEQRCIERDAHVGELGVEDDRLCGVSREPIEDEALLGIILGKALLHEADHEIVGDELALVHEGLGLLAELGAILDGGTEQVARRDVRHTVFSDQTLGLGAFARTGAAEQNDFHANSLLLSVPFNLSYLKNPS